LPSDEFKFLIRNTTNDWEQGFCDKVEIKSDGSLALWSIPDFEANIQLPDFEVCPAAVAFQAPDSLFIIDAMNGNLYKYDITRQSIEKVPCFGNQKNSAPLFKSPVGLAAGKDILYMVDNGYHRVIAFSLNNNQILFILGAIDGCNQPAPGNKQGEFDHPTDMALDSDENIYVVDQGNKRIQKFNKRGKFLLEFTQEKEGEKFIHPTHIAIDSDNYIYLLDTSKPYLVKLDSKGNFIDRICDFNSIPDFNPSRLAIDSKHEIYMGETGRGENGRIHIFDKMGSYLGTCAGFKGSANSLTTDSYDNLYVASCNHFGVFAILKSGRQFISEGVYYTSVFDSTRLKTQWHRLTVKAEIPPKTRLEIYYYISDEFQSLIEIKNMPVNSWQGPIVSPEDALFQTDEGRYLWLKIMFFGDQFHTPILKSLGVYFPRLSYLRYLPAIYQENSESKEFLERFLSIFESFFQETEETIFSIARFFDPLATDKEFLPWLANWLAIILEESWDESRKRQFIAQAYSLYKKKGTRAGLEQILQIYTGQRPYIIEHFASQTPMILGTDATLGKNAFLGRKPKRPLEINLSSTIGEFALRENEPEVEEYFNHFVYDFTVIVNAKKLSSDEQLIRIKRVIEEEKPAHTRCTINFCGTEMRIGVSSYIELGTVLTCEPAPLQLGIKSVLGKDTILKSKELAKGKIGTRSQIGIDTLLN